MLKAALTPLIAPGCILPSDSKYVFSYPVASNSILFVLGFVCLVIASLVILDEHLKLFVLLFDFLQHSLPEVHGKLMEC